MSISPLSFPALPSKGNDCSDGRKNFLSNCTSRCILFLLLTGKTGNKLKGESREGRQRERGEGGREAGKEDKGGGERGRQGRKKEKGGKGERERGRGLLSANFTGYTY